jgi:hypothetical protein
MIVLPAMLATLPRHRPVIGLAAIGLFALVALAQPDAALALALVGGSLGIAIARRTSPSSWLAAGLSAAGLAATLARGDPLQPVAFVETALGDAWRAEPIVGTAMAGSLAAAIFAAPSLVVRDMAAERASAFAVSGTFAGFALASFLLAHPQPLIGYGAAPILGMGLALAVLRFSR